MNLESGPLSDPMVQRLAREFVTIKIDARTDNKLILEFDASWAGDLLVVGTDRSVLEKFGDSVSARQVAGALERLVKAGLTVGPDLARYVLAPRTVDAAGQRVITGLIDDLDADEIVVREVAFRRLLESGPPAHTQLRAAVPNGRSAEWRTRTAFLLVRMDLMNRRARAENLHRHVVWLAGWLESSDSAIARLAHARLTHILRGLTVIPDGLPSEPQKLGRLLREWWNKHGANRRWNEGAEQYER